MVTAARSPSLDELIARLTRCPRARRARSSTASSSCSRGRFRSRARDRLSCPPYRRRIRLRRGRPRRMVDCPRAGHRAPRRAGGVAGRGRLAPRAHAGPPPEGEPLTARARLGVRGAVAEQPTLGPLRRSFPLRPRRSVLAVGGRPACRDHQRARAGLGWSWKSFGGRGRRARIARAFRRHRAPPLRACGSTNKRVEAGRNWPCSTRQRGADPGRYCQSAEPTSWLCVPSQALPGSLLQSASVRPMTAMRPVAMDAPAPSGANVPVTSSDA